MKDHLSELDHNTMTQVLILLEDAATIIYDGGVTATYPEVLELFPPIYHLETLRLYCRCRQTTKTVGCTLLMRF